MKVCPKCFTEVEDTTRFCPNCGESIPAPQASDQRGLLGKTIADKYVVLELVGEGAMGSIYRADQVALGKTVCIKVLHPHLTGDMTLSKRFHREARAASRIKHPNAINIIDFGTTAEGTHYIAMDFIDGMDLAHLLKKEFPLHPLRIIHLSDQICSALDEAHAQGIVHRDLKPENIMVEDRRHQKDFVTVLDFGIAKIRDPGRENPETFHTMAGIVCGTPEYMSPEQARGETLDARTDIYSLGIILYQLNTGKLPFTGDTPIGVVTKHLTVEPPSPRQVNPSIHPGMEQLILRLIAKDRNSRPANCLEVKQLLKEVRRTLEREDEAFSSTAPMTRPSVEELKAAVRNETEKKPATAPFEKAAMGTQEAEETVLTTPGTGRAAKAVVALVILIALAAGVYFGRQYLGLTGSVEPEQQAKAQSTAAVQPGTRTSPGPAGSAGKEAARPEPQGKPGPEGGSKGPAGPSPEEQQKMLVRAAAVTTRLQEQKQQYESHCDKLLLLADGWKQRHNQEKAEAVAQVMAACGDSRIRVAAFLDNAARGRIDQAEKEAEEEAGRLSEFSGKAALFLGETLPPLEDRSLEARRQLEELAAKVTADRTSLAEKSKALEARKAEWAEAGRQDKAEAIGKLHEQVTAVEKELEAIQAGLSVEKLDQFVADYSRTSGRQQMFMAEVDKTLAEPVTLSPEEAARRKAEEEKRKAEDKKKKELADQKAREEEEKRKKAEEEKKKKEEEEAKKAAAKAEAARLIGLGDQAIEAGNYAKAIAYYKEVMALAPGAGLHKKLGKAYNSQGDYAKGAHHLKTYLKLMEGKLSPVEVELIKKQIRE